MWSLFWTIWGSHVCHGPAHVLPTRHLFSSHSTHIPMEPEKSKFNTETIICVCIPTGPTEMKCALYLLENFKVSLSYFINMHLFKMPTYFYKTTCHYQTWQKQHTSSVWDCTVLPGCPSSPAVPVTEGTRRTSILHFSGSHINWSGHFGK